MTAVSVVKTVRAALEGTGRQIPEITGAFVGCGFSGMSSLRLILARSPHSPAGMILCNLPGSGPRLRRLAAELASRMPGRRIRVIESGPALPDAVYEADVLVTAGGTAALLEVNRLRPGTIASCRLESLLHAHLTAPDGASKGSQARAPPGCRVFHHAHSEPLNGIPRPRRRKQGRWLHGRAAGLQLHCHPQLIETENDEKARSARRHIFRQQRGEGTTDLEAQYTEVPFGTSDVH
ncbi:hypothetical protein OG905_09290 [Streptomyces sp. NBC_00322]|uniref:hypothetical protein n=1 Tax=Streptomyces sp. NBC_00322 TaxID=2975712 RepID=UPI002E29AE97|nr:hypothetical protein [Streptomyces sp. NBC_00322]